MNCEDFNKILPELADYQPMQVELRDDGLSHTALCAGCARKLVNARALSGNLLLAAGAESESAPARVKESLLAAFAEQQPAQSQTTSVVDISTRRKRMWWIGAAAAIAAVIVLAVILPVWRETPSPVLPMPIASGPVVESSQPPITNPGTVNSQPPLGVVDAIRKRRSFRQQTDRIKTSPKGSETVALNGTKEYLPLTYLANSTAMDTGTVIRVQLSRSALVSLGLPMNMESSRDSIEAEVVVGDDGVARAIRLVQ